ncbi:mitochondrial mRNA pseudouridine synthase Rpusd3-like [Asterias amurensis]|uniref:mitochondrial mRNA pseudouridine synthase Rpusd3-like n=1 Tax=Asterias amurensis TaxID=7602 RepID=UPI003AB7F57F
MQTLRRVVCKLCASSSVSTQRIRQLSSVQEITEHSLAEDEEETGNHGNKKKKKMQRNRLLQRPDESVFASHGFPQFENMTKDEFAKHIADSQVYNHDGVIGLNKPAGIHVTGTSENQMNIVGVIPEVMEAVGKPAGEIAKAADRESSGLILLGETKEVTRKINDAFINARKRNQMVRKYWTVALGIPTPAEGTINIPIGPEQIGNQTLMVPKMDPSMGSFDRKETLRCKTDYKVLSANHHLNCSLIELQPLKLQKHQLQVHLTSKLCSILGDRTYSNRIQHILGVRLLVDPHHVTMGTQDIPDPIKTVLHLRTWHMSRLPLFLHWYQATLPKWTHTKDLIITAPPPPYFMEALQRLDLCNQTLEDRC